MAYVPHNPFDHLANMPPGTAAEHMSPQDREAARRLRRRKRVPLWLVILVIVVVVLAVALTLWLRATHDPFTGSWSNGKDGRADFVIAKTDAGYRLAWWWMHGWIPLKKDGKRLRFTYVEGGTRYGEGPKAWMTFTPKEGRLVVHDSSVGGQAVLEMVRMGDATSLPTPTPP